MGKEFYPIDLKLNVSKKIHSVDARVSREKKKKKITREQNFSWKSALFKKAVENVGKR